MKMNEETGQISITYEGDASMQVYYNGMGQKVHVPFELWNHKVSWHATKAKFKPQFS